MPHRTTLARVLTIALVSPLLASARIAAQQSPADTTNSLLTALAQIRLSGYVETSYSVSTRPSRSVIVGRLFDRLNDQFMLNALKISLDKPYASSRLDAGFHTDILFGQNATPIQSTGLRLGDQGDLTQLYVVLNVPTPNGHGVQFRVGKMVSLLGVETLDPVRNPVWSMGYQAAFVENATSTGLDVNYRINRHVEVEARFVNGADRVSTTNSHKSVAAQLRMTPDAASYIAVLGYVGPQEANSSARRYGTQGIVSYAFTKKLTTWIQGDYGREQANDALPNPTRDAIWWAVGGWLTYDVASEVGLALRGDYLRDEQGARTSGVFGFPPNVGQKVGSATATLNVRSWPNVLIRPEVRYDRSSLATAFGGHDNQFTFALSVNYVY